MQDFVGGYIEIVPMPHDGRVLVCDDNGKFKGYAVNAAATQKFYPGVDVVVGDVLICDMEFMS